MLSIVSLTRLDSTIRTAHSCLFWRPFSTVTLITCSTPCTWLWQNFKTWLSYSCKLFCWSFMSKWIYTRFFELWLNLGDKFLWQWYVDIARCKALPFYHGLFRDSFDFLITVIILYMHLSIPNHRMALCIHLRLFLVLNFLMTLLSRTCFWALEFELRIRLVFAWAPTSTLIW